MGVFRKARQAEGDAGAVVGRPAEEACARRAVGDGGRQRVQHVRREGEGEPGRNRLRDRGVAPDRRPQRPVQERPQSERRAAVPELLLLARGPAAVDRRRRPAFAASWGQGETWAQAVQRDQEDEGRSGGGGKDERADQGALQQAVRSVMPAVIARVGGQCSNHR